MRNILLRTWGLLIILRTLLPLIWILVLFSGVFYFYSTTREALDKVSAYTQNLEEKHFGPIKTEISKVQTDLDAVSNDLTDLSNKVKEIGKIDIPDVDLPDIPLSKIPLVDLKDIVLDVKIPEVSIPGLDLVGDEMAALFCGNDGCHFNELKSSLNTVQASFEGFITETQVITAEITNIFNTAVTVLKIFFWLVLITILIVIPSFVIRYIQSFWTNLQKGWKYLSGAETNFSFN